MSLFNLSYLIKQSMKKVHNYLITFLEAVINVLNEINFSSIRFRDYPRFSLHILEAPNVNKLQMGEFSKEVIELLTSLHTDKCKLQNHFYSVLVIFLKTYGIRIISKQFWNHFKRFPFYFCLRSIL